MIWRTDTCQAVAGRDERGFTLIEILVVLVVIGLMIGLVVARGPPHSDALDMRAAVDGVAQTLRAARARAIATDRRIVVTVDPATHSYWTDPRAPHLLPARLGIDILAASGQAAGAPPAKGGALGIGFLPDGSSTGGQISFVEGARRRDVSVDWLTGRVSVADAG
jgi:general secretion pathway protein H